MGEKKDSGSKDADNFGAEFGTDRRLAQRQASQAALTSRAGDDRASGKKLDPLNFSFTTVPKGGAIAPATLTSTTLDAATTVPAVKPPSISVPEAERLLLAQQNLARQNAARSTPLTFEQEVQNLINSPSFDAGADLPPSVLDNLASDDDAMIFDEDDLRGDLFLNPSLPQDPRLTDRDTRNFGAEFGGINPITADVSPVLALTRNAMNQGSGIASLPTGTPSDTDLFNFGSEFGMFTDPLVASSVMLDTRNALNQGKIAQELDAEDADPGTTVAQELDAEDAALAVSPSPLPRPVQPNFITRGLSALSDSLGQKALAGQIRDLQEFMEVPGAKFDYTTRQGVAPAGRGELRISPNGFVTYSGPKDASYTGPFANLVNPPERPEKDAGDPCPPGFQLIDGVCRPMFDIMGPATPAPPAPGSNFQMAPTSGFPTSFAPMTQATPVSLPDPFVLSPTGAAIGRRV